MKTNEISFDSLPESARVAWERDAPPTGENRPGEFGVYADEETWGVELRIETASATWTYRARDQKWVES